MSLEGTIRVLSTYTYWLTPLHTAWSVLDTFSVYSSTLKMKALRPSETFVDVYWIALSHISDDSIFIVTAVKNDVGRGKVLQQQKIDPCVPDYMVSHFRRS
jgi:hypothetical protein